MARNATILKARLQIADIDRHYYETCNLTVAQHPSETAERLMVRLLAFALHAGEGLSFTRGLSTDNEPDIWRKDLRGDIELWIDVGQPEEGRIRKACQRSQQVYIYNYGGRGVESWWSQVAGKLSRFGNLSINRIAQGSTLAMASMLERHMDLQYYIDEGEITLSNEKQSINVEQQNLCDLALGV